MHPSKTRFLSLRLASGVFVLAFGAAAAQPPDAVAEVGITPARITWTPRAAATKWLLTVSGEGVDWRQLVAEGEPAQLQVFLPGGFILPDGHYDWELRAIVPPSGPPKGAEPASSSARRRVPPPRGPKKRPSVAWGSFRVRNGEFEACTETERIQSSLEPSF